MNKHRFLGKLKNNQKNVRFADFTALLEAFGFVRDRTKGSHINYRHGSISALMNVQDAGGKAKPYQVRQFLDLLRKHDLKAEVKSAEIPH